MSKFRSGMRRGALGLIGLGAVLCMSVIFLPFGLVFVGLGVVLFLLVFEYPKPKP